MTREEIIQANPIVPFLEKRGHTFKTKGTKDEPFCLCPLHDEKTASFNVFNKGTMFYCFGCLKTGSVIDLIMMLDGIDTGAAMRLLSPNGEAEKPVAKPKPQVQSKLVETYDYHDGGDACYLYSVFRYEPKTFRQGVRTADGVDWGMKGISKVLYRLDEVSRADIIWLVEGEKDVETLRSLGFTATCNPGGAGKWADSYSESLRGKKVYICPDNDVAGFNHMQLLVEALSPVVSALKVVLIPFKYKDVSDYMLTYSKLGGAGEMKHLAAEAKALDLCSDIPIKSMKENAEIYRQFVQNLEGVTVDLSKWLPSLHNHLRPLVPGELMSIIADTGVGKSAILQNIAYHLPNLKILMFNLELPDTLVFERFISIDREISGIEVEKMYIEGGDFNTYELDHIWTCDEAYLTPQAIQKIIQQATRKIGQKPHLVMVDYIGLVRGRNGASRYERISDAAQSLKMIAKQEKVVVIMNSQIRRKNEDESGEIFLHDGKDSGAIEESSGMLWGVWRHEDDKAKMYIKILKVTKGGGGLIVECTAEWRTMNIRERTDNGE